MVGQHGGDTGNRYQWNWTRCFEWAIEYVWELPATTLQGGLPRRSGDCIHEGHCYGVTEWNPDRFHSRERAGSSLRVLRRECGWVACCTGPGGSPFPAFRGEQMRVLNTPGSDSIFMAFSPVGVLLVLAIGTGAGVMVGIMGGSGVMVVVPMLTLLLSFPVHTAIGTSLLIDVIATVVTTTVYHRHQNVYVKPGLWIAAGSVAGALVGSRFADMIPPVGMVNLFGLLLVPTGVYLWVKGLGRPGRGIPGGDDQAGAVRLPVQTRRQQLTALGLGVFVGIMCGLFGAGGGGMILLILIFVLRYPVHLAVGTSSFIMMITATSGTAGYVLHGNIDIQAALIASVPTVLTAGIGAGIANRVGERTLGRIIGFVLAALGLAMIATQFLAGGSVAVTPAVLGAVDAGIAPYL